MARAASTSAGDAPRRRAPAFTPEDKESKMIAMAMDIAEKRLADGTAPNQMVLHFLRQATIREQLEKERLMEENALLRAKTEALESAKATEELYRNAIEAMKLYSPTEEKE